MRIIIIMILLLGSIAHAGDKWICTDESSSRDGNVWTACGVGEGSEERSARETALKATISEFATICALSTDCNEKRRTIEPKRTTCSEARNGVWKCYRMIQVTILP